MYGMGVLAAGLIHIPCRRMAGDFVTPLRTAHHLKIYKLFLKISTSCFQTVVGHMNETMGRKAADKWELL